MNTSDAGNGHQQRTTASNAMGADAATSQRTSQSPQAGTEPAGDLVARRFKVWSEQLLDLSLRNRLLNCRLDTKSSLPLIVPDIGLFEDLLAGNTPLEVAFDAVLGPSERPTTEGRPVRRVVDFESLKAGRVGSPVAETPFHARVVHLEKEARTAREEGGATVLYAAIGFLRWFESDASAVERLAPLLLVPIALDYARATRRLTIRRIAEDPLPNVTLIEKMRVEFALDLSALSRIEPDDSGLDIPAMIAAMREAVRPKATFQVLAEAHIGVFSFMKSLMWKDLTENRADLLQSDVVRRIATRSGDQLVDPVGEPAPERLDAEVAPDQLPLVVDADSSQVSAVVAALRGRNFVLQGPPGTGKSQTITNLIASAIAKGKSVLFVSEKMAALEVVQRRLSAVGLGDFCLELHSHKTDKRRVAQALLEVFERTASADERQWKTACGDIVETRDTLNGYASALHAPTPLGRSFYQVGADLLKFAKVADVRLTVANGRDLEPEALRRIKACARDFGESAGQVEPIATHPFASCLVDGWSAERDRRTRDALEAARAASDELIGAEETLLRLAGVPAPASLASLERVASFASLVGHGTLPKAWGDPTEWRALRRAVEEWRETLAAQERRRSDLATRWNPVLFDVALDDLEARFQRWSGMFFLIAWLFLFSARRRLHPAVVGTMPKNLQVARDLTTARSVKATDDLVATTERNLRANFGPCGADHVTAMEALLTRGDALSRMVRGLTDDAEVAAVERLLPQIDPEASGGAGALRANAERVVGSLQRYRAALADLRELLAVEDRVLPSDGPAALTLARSRIENWLAGIDRYRPWCLYRQSCAAMNAQGLSQLVDHHAQGTFVAADTEAVTERSLLTAWLLAVRDAVPVLRDFDGIRHHRLVERFRNADRRQVDHARHSVLASLEGRLPKGGDQVSAGEPGILIREAKKKRAHIPLRKLFVLIPNLLPRLKPCFLMSPLSVAQYLPAGGRRFDLVVFDEASQICTSDAIGALARANQVVVVGDSKQLPPTNFFRSANDDEPVDEDVVELESVLDEAVAAGLPYQTLRWHYRSRHDALIEFSNQHYYDGRLNVFPAARGRVPDLGVEFRHVPDGIYDAGDTRTNPREAEVLVLAVVEKLRRFKPEERTFGVVTFSLAQKTLIDDQLTEARARWPEIEPHFTEPHPQNESFFVKNLENVQGDERDEIYFSICYGPDKHGKQIMSFGPLSRDGGERRLNVAITRARKQLRVFSTMTHDHIDTNRAKTRGAHDLKDFLRFAADRSVTAMARADEASGDFESGFEQDVYDVLRTMGYRVDTQVGCSSYRIDLAVVHPDQPGVYVLGIECDGAPYHSGATARDRDRLRQSVLEGLGWRMHRIWSTDWSYARGREVERLQAAVEEAIAGANADAVLVEAPVVPASAEEVRVTEPPALPAASPPPLPSIPPAREETYRRCDVVRVADDPETFYHYVHTGTVRGVAVFVAEQEAPVHFDELARRVIGAFGGVKVTPRVKTRLREILVGDPRITVVDEFVWHTHVDRSQYDLARRAEGPYHLRELDIVPVEEIAVAADRILAKALSMPQPELLREVARFFGIQRLGIKVEERARAGVEHLVRKGRCTEEGGRVIRARGLS